MNNMNLLENDSLDCRSLSITKSESGSKSLFSRAITKVNTNALDEKYNKIAQRYNLSEIQNDVLLDVLEVLIGLMDGQDSSEIEYPKIEISYGGENEVILSFSSLIGIHILALDEDGDVVVNVAGFQLKNSWKKFFDFNNYRADELVEEFLTSFKFGNN